tara:strand:- start:4375 stop:4866 length:492 start_codon:yes stop_codon:yes gene_type:complete
MNDNNVNWYSDQVDSPVCEIKFKKTHENAILPRKAHPDSKTGDTGYDLFASEDTTIPANGSAVVPVGLTLADITPGYWFRIEPRSGLGFKHSLQPHLGVIDNPYRGDLGVKLYNFGDKDVVIPKSSGVAQIAVYENIDSVVSFVDEVTDTDRGEAGFGSTGGA